MKTIIKSLACLALCAAATLTPASAKAAAPSSEWNVVRNVTDVSVHAGKHGKITVVATGQVWTSGWTIGKLVPNRLSGKHPGGVYIFDFVASVPHGIMSEKLLSITAENYVWKNAPGNVRTIIVRAGTNQISKRVP